MPGHARAAIMAMEARYRNFNGSGQTNMAEQYRLVDPLDDSKYLSVQNFNDNAINPCIESTYSFIEKVVMEIKNMHDSAVLFRHVGLATSVEISISCLHSHDSSTRMSGHIYFRYYFNMADFCIIQYIFVVLNS
jgi:N-acetyl-beta-hexosaminidase